jgi:hypothetical protein
MLKGHSKLIHITLVHDRVYMLNGHSKLIHISLLQDSVHIDFCFPPTGLVGD